MERSIVGWSLGALAVVAIACSGSAPPEAEPKAPPPSGPPSAAPSTIALRAERIAEVGIGPRALAFEPKRRLVCVSAGGSGAVVVIDARARKVARSVRVGGAPSAIAAGGGLCFVATGNDVVVVDPLEGDVLGRVEVGPDVSGLALARGKLVVAHAEPGTVSLVDVARRSVTGRIDVRSRIAAIAADPDGRGAWIAEITAGRISFVDATRARLGRRIVAGGAPSALAVGPGRVFVTSADQRTLAIVDLAGKGSVSTVTIEPEPVAVTLLGDRLFVAHDPSGAEGDGAPGAVWALDAAGAPLGSVPAGAAPSALAVDPQTQTVWVAAAGSHEVLALDAG